MRLLWLFLLTACIAGGDENNCLPISCHGCCAADGTCHPGTEPTQCGQRGAACVDCARAGQQCSAQTFSCR